MPGGWEIDGDASAGSIGRELPEHLINKALPGLPAKAESWHADLVVLTYKERGFDLQRVLKLGRSAAEREIREAQFRRGIRPLRRIT
jgi:hypothetical protein